MKDEAKRQMMKPSLKLKPEDVLENELISDYIEQPSEILIMRMVLHHIAKVCVDINRHMNCAACQENQCPELKKHKKPGGCLTSSEFSKCTLFVYKVIEPNDLICLYNAVCHRMEMLYSGSDMLAKAIMAWIPLAEVSKTLDEEKNMFTEAFTEDTDWGYTTKFEECQNPIIAPVNWPLKYLISKTYFDLHMRPSLEKKLSVKSFLK